MSIRQDWKRYVAGVVFGIGAAVILAVAGELTSLETLGDIDLDGLAATAIRAAASAVAAVLGSRIPK